MFAALVLVGSATPAIDPALVRAGNALERAYDATWDARVSICGDRGRQAELMRLERAYQALATAFERRAGKPPVNYWISYHGEGCERWGRYRPSVIAARLALADAREALGVEE